MSEMEAAWGGGGGGGHSSSMQGTFTWLDSVNSTMDEAKNLISAKKLQGTTIWAVAAREQLNGRGTKGRAWMGLPGNVFLTIAVPLSQIPVPLSLVPLRVGTLMAPEIQRRLSSSSPAAADMQQRGEAPLPPPPPPPPPPPRVALKWPNDVLVDGRKVAGVLMEAELPYLLVGIGVNVRHRPEVPSAGPDRGRPAACLREFGAEASDEAVQKLASALTEAVRSWVSGPDTAAAALGEWSAWVDWAMPMEIRAERRAVTPVGVELDGRLRVKDKATGREQLLATEYLL